jgi:hypothetical protein
VLADIKVEILDRVLVILFSVILEATIGKLS